MTRRVRQWGPLVLLAGAACLGGRRARPPQPATPPPVAPIDTVKQVTPDTTPKPAPRLPALDTMVRGAPPRPAGETSPGQRCVLDVVGRPGSRSFLAKSPNGKYVTYLGGGMTGRCARQDITITADSVESYEENRIYYLIGNVKYREKRVNLDAQRVSYFGADERLLFEQDVKATLPNGTTMVGPTAEYFRAVRGVRAAARLIGRGRPTVTFIERDSLGKAAAPVELVADVLTADGDSLFYASRAVVLTRTDLVARSDSGFVHSGRQYARLMVNPVIESKGDEPYTLKGKAIDIHARNRQAERVVAQDSASAVSKDLNLEADTIDLRVNEQKLQQAFAFGRRAHATTAQRDVFAESLHVVMPNQRIREFYAVGFAYAETDPDTVKIISDERDWLRGDTIHAVFDSLATNDTTSRPPIRKLTASGNASSFYQVPSNDSTRRGPPAINYVTGRIIDVQFDKDEVQTVRVIEQASGVYLEPAAPGDTSRTNRSNPRATRRPPGPIRPPSLRGPQ